MTAETEDVVRLWMRREVRVMVQSLVQIKWVAVESVEVRVEGIYLIVQHRGERQVVVMASTLAVHFHRLTSTCVNYGKRPNSCW